MGAKTIAISADDITYNNLPGSQGELSREGAVIDDTIFGQSFKSGLTGILTWSVTANAVYKGFAGYLAKLKKPGTPTAAAGEACTVITGKTYQINNTAKRVWDRTVNVVVKDNAVDHTADVASVNYLFGKVTFDNAYAVVGPVTVDVTYLPMVDLGKAQSYTLTQTADAIKDTDFPTAQANGGFNTHRPGLRTIAAEFPVVHSMYDDWQQFLIDRNEIIIEINPDGNSKSIARGFFRLMSDRQSGNVGALEQENISFSLNVPLADSGDPDIELPFSWSHTVDSPIPAAIKTALDAYIDETEVYVKYLPEGTNGVKGQGVVTNLSLTGGMEAPNVFAVTVIGDGGLTDVAHV